MFYYLTTFAEMPLLCVQHRKAPAAQYWLSKEIQVLLLIWPAVNNKQIIQIIFNLKWMLGSGSETVSLCRALLLKLRSVWWNFTRILAGIDENFFLKIYISQPLPPSGIAFICHCRKSGASTVHLVISRVSGGLKMWIKNIPKKIISTWKPGCILTSEEIYNDILVYNYIFPQHFFCL